MGAGGGEEIYPTEQRRVLSAPSARRAKYLLFVYANPGIIIIIIIRRIIILYCTLRGRARVPVPLTPVPSTCSVLWNKTKKKKKTFDVVDPATV